MRMGDGRGAWLGAVRLTSQPILGQAVTCETTPEGGKVCSDGTYHPPGCAMTPGAPVVQASGGFPTVPVVVGGVAAIAAGAFLLSGRRLGAALDADYPEVVGHLQTYADAITAERAQDAADFKALTDAGATRLAALDRQGNAQRELEGQSRLWEASHHNADALKAAQAAYDSASADLEAATLLQQEYRDKVNSHAQTIDGYRSQVQALIDNLPADYRDQAWAMVDPCHPVKIGGRGMGWGMRPLSVPNRRNGFFA